MKKILFLSLIISLIIISCTQQVVNSSIQGAWRLISGNETTPDTSINYPLSTNGRFMKIIGKEYYSTVWQDTTINKSNWLYGGFNGGTYTFENEVYTETATYFSLLPNIGSKVAFKAEIKNDTLVITYIPEKAMVGYSSTEKWKRLE
jgi:hypothetical protein